MYASGQNLVAGHSIDLFDAAGTQLGTATFGADAPNGANQSTLVAATPAAESQFGIAADTGMPSGLLDPTGGAVCWESLDCVSWGSLPRRGPLADRLARRPTRHPGRDGTAQDDLPRLPDPAGGRRRQRRQRRRLRRRLPWPTPQLGGSERARLLRAGRVPDFRCPNARGCRRRRKGPPSPPPADQDPSPPTSANPRSHPDLPLHLQPAPGALPLQARPAPLPALPLALHHEPPAPRPPRLPRQGTRPRRRDRPLAGRLAIPGAAPSLNWPGAVAKARGARGTSAPHRQRTPSPGLVRSLLSNVRRAPDK